jgi:uncharacterized delta-60 repeat protein
MRTIFLVALLLVLFSGCAGGEQETQGEGNREFTAAHVVVRGDGRILLAGLATRGRPESEEYSECRGEGRATRDFAVVHLSPTGRIEGDYSVTEAELEACAVEFVESRLDADGGLTIIGRIHEPPGLSERIFGPEDSGEAEPWYAARFAPEGPFDESLDVEQLYEGVPSGDLAYVRMPNGDWVGIGEDPSRERRDIYGMSYGTISLMRFGQEPSLRPRWSVPIRAIPDNLDLEDLELGDRMWALFFDPRRGFYGFAAYSKLIDEDEESAVDEFVLFRHRPDGRPDMSFGDRGRVLLHRGPPASVDPLQVVRAPDGDFIVVGIRIELRPVYRRHVYLQRVNPDGRFDRRFGRDGVVDLEGVGSGSVTSAVDANGKLVVAISSEKRGTAVLRLLPDGRLDRSFGRSGLVVIHTV